MRLVPGEMSLDGQRFDEITKTLALGTSRRRVIRGLGATVLGSIFAWASVGKARADEDDDEFEDDEHDEDDEDESAEELAECQEKLTECGSKETYLKCAECTAEVEAECSGLLGTDLAAGTCLCSSHAYCTDENGCTLDVCGPETGQCYHLPITDSCVECEDDEQCPDGGTCCEGRCCAAGATCQPGPGDVGICCITCEPGGASCCDQISLSEPDCFGPGCSVGFVIDDATCFYGEGACAGCPAICASVGFCDFDEDPSGTSDPTCPCILSCVAPVGRFF